MAKFIDGIEPLAYCTKCKRKLLRDIVFDKLDDQFWQEEEGVETWSVVNNQILIPYRKYCPRHGLIGYTLDILELVIRENRNGKKS